tara:strand:- start:571 stop:1908 length:1338 start_codon:yes stop_codon:yes gene_type:complete
VVTVNEISQQAVINSLSDALAVVETKRHKEREYLLDYFEGINTEFYVKKFFGSESLQQVPIFNQNLTRRVCSLRSLSYRRPPKTRVDERYYDFIDKEGLISSRRQLERLTYLLGTTAYRCRWNELKQRVEYENLPFFEPLFLPGEREPWGVMYAIENQGMSKMERPMFAIWTEDRLDKKGMHFLIDADGKKKSVNPGDVNPYGILPVLFTHRYQPVRDFYVGGAEDVVSCDLSVSVAMSELALCVRFGAIGIKFVSGVDDASRIEIGVDKILYLPEGTNFGVTAPSGSLTDIVEATKFMVSATLENNSIRVKYIDSKGNAPSAESLKIQEVENTNENMASAEDTWRPFEKKRFEIDRRIIEVKTGVVLDPEYSCDFLEANYPMTTMDEINFWNWRFENGLADPTDWFDYNNPDAPQSQRDEFKARLDAKKEQQPANRLLSRLTAE